MWVRGKGKEDLAPGNVYVYNECTFARRRPYRCIGAGWAEVCVTIGRVLLVWCDPRQPDDFTRVARKVSRATYKGVVM
jgi:hypothetical protein